MKIATYNINNVNKRLENLLSWLGKAEPDVVCLQELKAEHRNFPRDAIAAAGYHAVWQGERSWNGVAILAKQEPVLTSNRLPGDDADRQARYIEAAVDGIVIGCIYLPNGNPQPGPKFAYKLSWFDRLIDRARQLRDQQVPAVLAGDFNVVPDLELDIYTTRSWDKDALTQPEARKRFQLLLDSGWLDSLRALHPHTRIYSYWDYKRQRWPRNAGLRLDHLLLSPELQNSLKAGGVDSWVRGEEGSSDHAPAWIEIERFGRHKTKTSRRVTRLTHREGSR
jgi:exodeoxyribonuclease-3